MIVTLSPDAPSSTAIELLTAATGLGFGARMLVYDDGGGVVGVDGALPGDVLSLPGIAGVRSSHKPYMLASREGRERTIVRVGDVEIGGERPVLMAGPCVVEGREQTDRGGARRQGRRRRDPPRRRLQTADLALRLPGARRGRVCGAWPPPATPPVCRS